MTQATVAKELVKSYGVSGLYCGWYWAMTSGFVEKGIYFFAYGARVIPRPAVDATAATAEDHVHLRAATPTHI
jgi:hypothetical protein